MVTIQFILKSAVSHLRMLFMDVLNQVSNTLVLSSSVGQFSRCPFVVCSFRNLYYSTNQINWMIIFFFALFDCEIKV